MSKKQKKTIQEIMFEVADFHPKKLRESQAKEEAEAAEMKSVGVDAMMDIFYRGEDVGEETIRNMLIGVIDNISKMENQDMRLLATNQLQLAMIS